MSLRIRWLLAAETTASENACLDVFWSIACNSRNVLQSTAQLFIACSFPSMFFAAVY